MPRYTADNHPGRMRVRRNLENGGIEFPDGSTLGPQEANELRTREHAERVQAHQEFLQRQRSEQAQAAYLTRQMKTAQREAVEANRRQWDQATGSAPYVDTVAERQAEYRRRYGLA
jgi:hypothetical protein